MDRVRGAVQRAIAGVVEAIALVEPVGVLGDVEVLEVAAGGGGGDEVVGGDVDAGVDERRQRLGLVEVGELRFLRRGDVLVDRVEARRQICKRVDDARIGGQRRDPSLQPIEADLEGLNPSCSGPTRVATRRCRRSAAGRRRS